MKPSKIKNIPKLFNQSVGPIKTTNYCEKSCLVGVTTAWKVDVLAMDFARKLKANPR